MDQTRQNRVSSLRLLVLGSVVSLYLLFAGKVLLAREAAPDSTWKTLNVKDVATLEWDDRYRMGKLGRSTGKLLYSNLEGATLAYINFVPGWDAYLKDAHYHDFHEWGYVLEGNFLIYEFVNPTQQMGTLEHMRAGTWMDRPAYSIHGQRADVMARQKIPPNSVHLAFAEGGETISLNPESRRYSDSWQDVKQWTRANFQHSATTEVMEWEDDKELPGVSVKWLSDNWQGGFRSVLRYAPPGWSHPGAPVRNYFKKAQRFFYILYGDLKVGTANGPDDAEQSIVVKQDYFIDQPPMSIWGWQEGPLTESGAMWLEVTYAEGTKVGGGPIEQPSLLP